MYVLVFFLVFSETTVSITGRPLFCFSFLGVHIGTECKKVIIKSSQDKTIQRAVADGITGSNSKCDLENTVPQKSLSSTSVTKSSQDKTIQRAVADGITGSNSKCDLENTVPQKSLSSTSVTKKPTLSLTIPSLTHYDEKHDSQEKSYKYEFSEGTVSFDCSLNNPTEQEVNYTITFYQPYLGNKTNGIQNKATVIIGPRSKYTLSATFSLNKNNTLILCSAVNKGLTDTPLNLRNEIELLYMPPPSAFVIITGSPKLVKGEYVPKELEQIYNYTFTDGETVTLNCSLEMAKGSEEEREHDHKFAFHVDEKGDGFHKTYQETFISRTFTLQSEDAAIHCIAYNVDGGKRYYSKVNLHYSPLPQDSTPNAEPTITVIVPSNLQRMETDLHYIYSDEENFTLKCFLENADPTKPYQIVLYNYNFFNASYEILISSKDLNESLSVWDTIALSMEDKIITCAASIDTKYIVGKEVYFQYVPSTHENSISIPDPLYNGGRSSYSRALKNTPTPILRVTGLPKIENCIYFENNKTKICIYNFTKSENVTLQCTLNMPRIDERTFDVQFFLDSYYRSGKLDSKSTINYITLPLTLTLAEEHNNKELKCMALIQGEGRSIATIIIRFKYVPPKPSGTMEIGITGLSGASWKYKNPNNTVGRLTKIFDYKHDKLDTQMKLGCVLSGNISPESTYRLSFEGKNKIVQFQESIHNSDTLSSNILLTNENKTIICNATKIYENNGTGNVLSAEIHFYYIPPPPTTTTSEPQFTGRVTTSTQNNNHVTPTLTSAEPSILSSSPAATEKPESQTAEGGWLSGSGMWIVLAGTVLLTVFVIGCSILVIRRRKPPPDDATYANLAKDQNSYRNLPVPAPRTIQKPGVGQQAAIDNTYSEPKDSQDMGDALYAEPNRFNGSETYAEPYVKSSPKLDGNCTYAQPYKSDTNATYAQVNKSSKKSDKYDTYAQPYKSDNYAVPSGSSEGNYAEVNFNKELNAKPVPKAQRSAKAKDDSNYSNVFGSQYGNTKK